MNRNEAMEKMCSMMSAVNHTVYKNRGPADCFCGDDPNYQNDGKAIDWIRQAIIDRMEREGYTVPRDIIKRKVWQAILEMKNSAETVGDVIGLIYYCKELGLGTFIFDLDGTELRFIQNGDIITFHTTTKTCSDKRTYDILMREA